MRRALNKGSPLPRIDDDLRAALSERYVDEFDQLDRRFGIDVRLLLARLTSTGYSK